MREYRHLHNSMLATIVVSAGALALGGQSTLFFFITLGVCAVSWRMMRRNAPPPFENRIASLACLAALMITLARLSAWGGGLGIQVLRYRVPRGGEFLLMLQWVLLFKQRGVREYALMHFISLVVMACAALLVPGLIFGFAFLAYLVAALCSMSLAQDLHERLRLRATLSRPTRRVRPSRLSAGFVGRRAVAALVLLLPTAVFFVALPRKFAADQLLGSFFPRPTGGPSVTGFSEVVAPGDVASVRQSREKVMEVEALPREGEEPSWNPAFRMRGMALDYYDGRVWTATRPRRPAVTSGRRIAFMYADDLPHLRHWSRNAVRCQVRLEQLDTRILFAPFALVTLLPEDGRLLRVSQLNDIVESVSPRADTLSYRTVSFLPPEDASPASALPMRFGHIARFLQLPPGYSERVRQEARRIAPLDRYHTPVEKARRLEQYLRDPENFVYDLNAGVSEGAEPVEDFLFARRRGHCEHFAASMVIMLRCLEIPARLVTGFIGGEWDENQKRYIFRQNHAHAWVEAYSPRHGWLPFDPTPAAGTPEYTLPPRQFAPFRTVRRRLSYLWINYVIGFDRRMQDELTQTIRTGAKTAGRRLATWTTGLIRFLLSEARSADGGRRTQTADALRRLGPILAGAAVIAIASLATLLLYRARRRRPAAKRPPLRSAPAFYRSFLRRLRRRGFRRQRWETAREFAAHVTAAAAAAAGPVQLITARYERVRYGGGVLSHAEEKEVREHLRQLDDRLLNSSAGRRRRGR